MASPNAASINTQLANLIKPFGDLIADYPTIVTDIDTAQQAYQGDFMPGSAEAILAALRARCSGSIGTSLMYSAWRAWGRERLRLAGLPHTNMDAVTWARLHRVLHEASETFNDRDLTIAATGTAGGSNVGTGSLTVLAVDLEGYNLQAPTSETKTFECVTDQNLGVNKGAEVFECRGEDASKDLLDESGSGIRLGISAMHAGSGSAGSKLQNSSFDAAFSGSGTDKIPGWTITGTASKITADTSNTYRSAPGATSDASLAFAADAAATNSVSQALSVRRLSAQSERAPWMVQIAYKHSAGSITGTLNVKLGSQTKAVNLTAATTSWQVVQLPFDKNIYYRNWKQDAPAVTIDVVNMSAGTLYVDDGIFAPLTKIDGLWWWLVGGATAFLQRDVFMHATTGGAWADAELMNSLRQVVRYERAPIMNMPVATGGTETIADA